MKEAGSDVEGTPPDLWGPFLFTELFNSWVTSLCPSIAIYVSLLILSVSPLRLLPIPGSRVCDWKLLLSS